MGTLARSGIMQGPANMVSQHLALSPQPQVIHEEEVINLPPG